MREKTIKKQFWINQEEENLLKTKSKKAGLNESEFLRSCIKGYKIKEQPTKEIREFMQNNYPNWKKNKYYKKQNLIFRTSCNIFYTQHSMVIKLYKIIRNK